MEPRLAELDAVSELLAKRGSDIDDFLNWHEATQSSVVSGDFAGYFRTLHEGSQAIRPRDDAISLYLDAVEAELR